MHRIDTPNRTLALYGAGKDGWRDGVMASGILPTEFNAAFLNAIQEEISGVVEGAGLALNPATNNQLLIAIENLIEVRAGNYALDTGAANAYVIALNPAITAYTNGVVVRAKVANANTGASTLNAGGGVVPLVNDVGSALAVGDLPAGSVFAAAYDLALNKFLITSLVPSQAITQTQADARYTPIASTQFGPTIAANITLAAAQSGMTFDISAGVVTLPAVAAGLRYRFIGTGAGTGVIAAPAAGINYPDGSAITSGNTVAIGTITTWEIICDGSSWVITNTSGQLITKNAVAANQAVPLGQTLINTDWTSTAKLFNTLYTAGATPREVNITITTLAGTAGHLNVETGVGTGVFVQVSQDSGATGVSSNHAAIVGPGRRYNFVITGAPTLVIWAERG